MPSCCPSHCLVDLTYQQKPGSEVYHSPILHHVLLKGLELGATIYYSVGAWLAVVLEKRPSPAHRTLEVEQRLSAAMVAPLPARCTLLARRPRTRTPRPPPRLPRPPMFGAFASSTSPPIQPAPLSQGDDAHGWSEELSFTVPRRGFPQRLGIIGDLGQVRLADRVAGLLGGMQCTTSAAALLPLDCAAALLPLEAPGAVSWCQAAAPDQAQNLRLGPSSQTATPAAVLHSPRALPAGPAAPHSSPRLRPHPQTANSTATLAKLEASNPDAVVIVGDFSYADDHTAGQRECLEQGGWEGGLLRGWHTRVLHGACRRSSGAAPAPCHARHLVPPAPAAASGEMGAPGNIFISDQL